MTLFTAEIDMANAVVPSAFLTDVAWVICSTYRTVLKASPGAAIFGWNMLFNIPHLADWKKIGDYRQSQTDLNTQCENCSCLDWDYKSGDQVLPMNHIVHTTGTIWVQLGTKLEQ